MSNAIGYAWIQEKLQTPDFLGSNKARLAQVQSLQRLPEGALLVPAKQAPNARTLEHALFALKHEGVRLDYLLAALRQVDAPEMLAEPELCAQLMEHWLVLTNQRPDGLDPLAHAALASFTLEVDLHQEVDFLALFDDVARYINQRYDLRSTDLTTLIVTIHQNGGKLSSNRRKRFAERAQSHVLDAIEAAVARRMDGLPLSEPEDED